MTAIIREARPEDIKTIIELSRKLAAFERAEYSVDGKSEKLQHFLFSAQPRVFCLLAQSEDQVSGFCTYSVEFSVFDADIYLRLNTLFISEAYRGQGIGRQFVAALQKEARRLDCRSVRFFTPAFNTPAIKFYHQLGATSKESIRFSLEAGAAPDTVS